MTNKAKAVLIGSLLLNVLLVGWIAGGALHHFERHRGFHRDERAVLKRLPESKRALFLKTMEETRAESREIRNRTADIRKKTLAILTAPQFDEQAYRDSVAKLHRLRSERMNRLADATGGLAMQFNQEERKILAKLLERHPVHPPREGPP